MATTERRRNIYSTRARDAKRSRDSKVLRVALLVGFFAAALFGSIIYLMNTVRIF